MTDGAARFLPYTQHTLDEDDIQAVVKVLQDGPLTTGPRVGALETRFTEITGAKHAVSCSSGTAALHLASLALGLGPGKKVIVPAMTFLATANAVRFTGADVVFADVDPASGLMAPSHLQDALDRAGPEVAAVYPVHLNGQCADMAALSATANGLAVVEDACHVLGGEMRTSSGDWTAVGSCAMSEMAIFSLHPAKIAAMGEGGIVTTNDGKTASKLARLRNHGMVREAGAFAHADDAFDAAGQANPWYYEMPEIGYNYRASDIHCALGISQLGKLGRFRKARQALADDYDRLLAPLDPRVRPLPRVEGCRPAWHLYVVHIDFAAAGMDRAALMHRLREAGIGSQVLYLPVNRQPYYRRLYGETRLPGADAYYESALALPLSVAMNTSDVERVVGAMKNILGE